MCVSSAGAKNPFLSAASDLPSAARFTGSEWGDEIAEKELPLRAQVVTTRVAQLAFGAVFRIEFVEIVSRAAQPRRIAPYYFLATDDEIAVLRDEDPDEAIARLKLMTKAPVLAADDIFGISRGSRTYPSGKLSVAKLTVAGDRCIYKWSHSSGHFVTVIWQRGVGLVELSKGRGARADGYRLVRTTEQAKPVASPRAPARKQ